jgi:hypothetical protein
MWHILTRQAFFSPRLDKTYPSQSPKRSSSCFVVSIDYFFRVSPSIWSSNYPLLSAFVASQNCEPKRFEKDPTTSPEIREPREPRERMTEPSTIQDSKEDSSQQAMSRGGVTMPFPFKLHELLERANHDEALAQILSWQPHGRSFVVHKPSLFVDHVMPQHFAQTKFASFQRQLNLYGFVRLTTGRDKNGYYNENFLRGHPELVSKLKREKIKGTKVRKAKTPGMEPSFYGMPFLPIPKPNPGEPKEDPKLRAVLSAVTVSTVPSSNSSHSLRGIPSSTSITSLSGMPTMLSVPTSVTLSGPEAVRHTTPPPFLPGNSVPLVTPPVVPTNPTQATGATTKEMPATLSFPTSTSHPALAATVSHDTTEATLGRSVSNPILTSSHSTGDLLYFEGRPFHYIDREVMMKIRKPLAARPQEQQQQLPPVPLPPPAPAVCESAPTKNELHSEQDNDDVGLDMDLWLSDKPKGTSDAITAKDVEWMFS